MYPRDGLYVSPQSARVLVIQSPNAASLYTLDIKTRRVIFQPEITFLTPIPSRMLHLIHLTDYALFYSSFVVKCDYRIAYRAGRHVKKLLWMLERIRILKKITLQSCGALW